MSLRPLALALLAGAALSGCGQRGELYLPTEPAAAGRATLPQALRPPAIDPAAPAGATQRAP